VPLERVGEAEAAIRQAVREQLIDLCARIEAGEKLGLSDKEAMLRVARDVVAKKFREESRADNGSA